MIFEEKLLRTFTMPLSLLKVLSFSKKISFSMMIVFLESIVSTVFDNFILLMFLLLKLINNLCDKTVHDDFSVI